ncbi:MAG TPA: hypothetical protein DEV73_03565 [Candidatus Zambryskibacteria bacterium]|nr:hypothetical protein [Candidatus Zambryskibacteria bacterium]
MIVVTPTLRVNVSDKTPYVPAVPKDGVVAANMLVGPLNPKVKTAEKTIIAKILLIFFIDFNKISINYYLYNF